MLRRAVEWGALVVVGDRKAVRGRRRRREEVDT
jgi:hypothetical protein